MINPSIIYNVYNVHAMLHLSTFINIGNRFCHKHILPTSPHLFKIELIELEAFFNSMFKQIIAKLFYVG